MTQVYGTLTDPTGRPVQRQRVIIRAVTPGNPFTQEDSAVVTVDTVDTDGNGRWTTDLIPVSAYEASGVYYTADWRLTLRQADAVFAFTVPDLPGPLYFRDYLITPPDPGTPIPAVPAHTLGSHTDVNTSGEADGLVLKFDAVTGKWEPKPDLTGGGGAGSAYQMFQDIPANVTNVPHNLGYRPGGVRLFSEDWAIEYDEFVVTHIDNNNLTVGTGALFRGYVTVS